MITLGIVTRDSHNDPSIKVLKELEEKFEYKLKLINLSSDLDDQDTKVDVLYPRISGLGKEILDKEVDFYIDLVEKTKVPHVGNTKNIKDLKNKFSQIKYAEACGLNVPKTILLKDGDKDKSIEPLSYPVVIKSAYSFGGQDVFKVTGQTELEEKTTIGGDFLIQEFISLDEIIDYRVYVVGESVPGGIIRHNKTDGEFRANTSQGGSATFFEPDDKLKKLALSYAKHVGAEIIAVDFIKNRDKYYFIESNDAFSVKTDNEPRKKLIAEEIIRYCLKKALQINSSAGLKNN